MSDRLSEIRVIAKYNTSRSHFLKQGAIAQCDRFAEGLVFGVPSGAILGAIIGVIFRNRQKGSGIQVMVFALSLLIQSGLYRIASLLL